MEGWAPNTHEIEPAGLAGPKTEPAGLDGKEPGPAGFRAWELSRLAYSGCRMMPCSAEADQAPMAMGVSSRSACKLVLRMQTDWERHSACALAITSKRQKTWERSNSKMKTTP